MMRTATLCSLALAILACNPDKGESNTDGAITDGATSGTTTDGATSGTTTDAATSGTTDDPTGGAAGPCVDYCVKLDECGVEGTADCPEGCPIGVARYEYAGEACGALYGESLACKAAATCEELMNDKGLCQDKLEALIVDACTTDLCDMYADRLIECNFIEAEGKVFTAFECTMALSENSVEIGAACGDAAEARIACVIKLECGQIDSAEGCEAESMAETMACG